MAAVPNISTAQLQGVSDPNMRNILRAIVDTAAVRNGDVGSGGQAFVTMDDLLGGGAKARSIASALARPIAYQVATEGQDPYSLGAALEQRIISSAAWQLMFSRVELLTAPDSRPGSISNQLLLEAKSRGAAITDVSKTVQQANESLAEAKRTLTAAIGDNAAAIQREERALASVNEALTQTRNELVAGIETNTRDIAASANDIVKISAAVKREEEARVTITEALATTDQKLTARIDTTAAGIQRDTAAEISRVDRALATATNSLAQSQQNYLTETNNAIAGLQQQITVNTNSDNATAKQITDLWNNIGDVSSQMQTGQELVSNRIGAVVKSYEQLQAVISDPVTGLAVSYAALRNDYSATNDKVNGMAAKWSVKLDLNGYVSGLSLNAGVTPEGKSESMMLFAADVFAVGAPGKPNVVPFAIDTQTGLVAIRGDLLVKNSITANSGILATASIGKAHIQDASVDTLKIGPNSVIVPAYAEGVNDGTNYYAGTMIEKGQLILTLADYGSIVAIVTFQSLSGIQGAGFNPTVKLAVNGQQFMYQSNSGSSSYHQAWTANGRVTLPPGRHVFTISFGNDWNEGWYQLGRWAITLLGVMR